MVGDRCCLDTATKSGSLVIDGCYGLYRRVLEAGAHVREKRLHSRFAVDDLDVQAAMTASTEAEIRDISAGGVSVVCSRNLGIGREYTLSFEVGRGTVVPVKAVVRWKMLMGSTKMSATSAAPLFLVGMEFKDALTEEESNILDVIKEIVDTKERRLRGVRFGIRSQERAIIDSVEIHSVKVISVGGMLVETNHELSAKDIFPMELILPDDDKPIYFRGRAVSSQQVKTRGVKHYRTGIEFVEMKQEDKTRLKAFLHFL
jgi:hypothetical protein